ncbi:MAG: heptaprenylglyceryl phosphate synthase [Actinobacteria bacterium]|nr:heptaprenylglyceryl phosphate synthase [Actinomycetota bacterium]
MNVDHRGWRRIVKLDPARPLSDERLAAVRSWGADAIVVGGSGGYGAEEVRMLLDRVRLKSPPGALGAPTAPEALATPVALEISDARAVCPGFDLYLVPMVLNSSDVDWVMGHHQAAIKRYADVIDWRKVVVEGYCVLNADATVARLSGARATMGIDDVVAFARLAEHLLKLPIFYLEYSGTYGPPEVVSAVRRVLSSTRLWYGGGIRTRAQAREMAALADTIVVGNAVYEGHDPFGTS